MIRKFEEENPDLLKEDEPKTPSQNTAHSEQKTASVEKISPRPVEFPPNPENRNFNENDILGDLERDDRGNLILLEKLQ